LARASSAHLDSDDCTRETCMMRDRKKQSLLVRKIREKQCYKTQIEIENQVESNTLLAMPLCSVYSDILATIKSPESLWLGWLDVRQRRKKSRDV
jgi:hypothetical protein